jgi:predicted transcriptional regulator
MLTCGKKVEGVTKTRIMYEAYLSYGQLKDYLSLLLGNGMLERTEYSKYRTTDKGVKMLEAYRKVNDLVSVKYD